MHTSRPRDAHVTANIVENVCRFNDFHYFICARVCDDDDNRNRNGMQFMKTLIEFSSEWHYFAFNEICHQRSMQRARAHTPCTDTRCATTTSQNADAYKKLAGWQERDWKPSASPRASQMHKLLLFLLAWFSAVQRNISVTWINGSE